MPGATGIVANVSYSQNGKGSSINIHLLDKIRAIDLLWRYLGFDRVSIGRDRNVFSATIRKALERLKT